MLDHAASAGMQIVRPEPPVPIAEAASLTLPGEHQRRNAACARAAVAALQSRVAVDEAIIEPALAAVRVAGRMEWREHQGREVLFDVAHNPAAAASLADTLASVHAERAIDMIFATLSDKDTAGVVAALSTVVRHWHCLQLQVPRAMDVDVLAITVRTQLASTAQTGEVLTHGSARSAWQAVSESGLQSPVPQAATPLVLVTGSFYTIAAVLADWESDGARREVDDA